ncbi:MAG: bifunctional riboflavin kinase/FAD synthetase [Desulfovibrio sp.]|nr:bifunctional riboflavin kinase/FAD synthetase [Desulfovibrio sp.]
MHVVHNPNDLTLSASAITIGNFDGVHRGHQSLILRTLSLAKQNAMPAIVVTFWPHPRSIVSPTKSHHPLTTREDRLALLGELGIPYVLELPFTKDLANLEPLAFVTQYLMPLSLTHLVTGYDFSLGRGRTGKTEELRRIGNELGFSVEQMPPLTDNGVIISSTHLRTLIAQGDIKNANMLLGRPYQLKGRVIHGFGRGKGLGFPTANIAVDNILLPAKGVYAANIAIQGKTVHAMVNIGNTPTFGENDLSIECHLLNYTGDCYDETLSLSLLAYLRPEQRFPSPEALIAQIHKDIAQAQTIFAK